MKSCMLHSLFLLLLSCNTSFSTFSFQDSSGREMRQYNDVEDESFIGLMGKRSSGEESIKTSCNDSTEANLSLIAELPLKRDVGDVFVGLFGRRNADSDELDNDLDVWRQNRRGGVIRKNRRLRFQRSA